MTGLTVMFLQTRLHTVSVLQLKFLSVFPLMSPNSESVKFCNFFTGTFCSRGPIFSKFAPSPPVAVSTCETRGSDKFW